MRKIVVFALVPVILAAVLTSVASAAPTPTCMKPMLRASVVSDGRSEYGSLVPGKSFAVAFYLSAPDPATCADAKQDTIVPRSEVITSVAGAHSTTKYLTPSGQPLAAWSNAPALESAADPRTSMPGSALDATGSSYVVTISLSMQYDVMAKGKVLASGASTFTQTASVDAATGGISVLLVPMGDTTSPTAHIWDSADQMVLDQAVSTTFSRLFPVADGVAGLLATSQAGVKYDVDADYINVGVHGETSTAGVPITRNYLNANGTWCGGSGSNDYVFSELARRMANWNSAHPEAPVSRAVGLISPAINSNGSSCAYGYAQNPGQFAWIDVASWPATGGPLTGSLLAHELAHTYGVDHALLSGPTDKVFDSRTGVRIPSPTSVMSFDPDHGWQDATTIYNAGQWNTVKCGVRVGGACP